MELGSGTLLCIAVAACARVADRARAHTHTHTHTNTHTHPARYRTPYHDDLVQYDTLAEQNEQLRLDPGRTRRHVADVQPITTLLDLAADATGLGVTGANANAHGEQKVAETGDAMCVVPLPLLTRVLE